MPPLQRKLAVLLAASHLGCATYRFGPPPPPPSPTATAMERCVSENALTLSSSSGTERLANETTGSGPTIYVRERSVTGDGFSFYRGSQRLGVDEGLRALGHGPLRASHEQTRASLSGAKTTQTIARPLWIALMTAGTVVTLVGISQLKADEKGAIDKTGLALTGAGLGGMIVSLPFLYLDQTSGPNAAAYDLHGKLYLPRSDEGPTLAAALSAHRREVERGCEAAR